MKIETILVVESLKEYLDHLGLTKDEQTKIFCALPDQMGIPYHINQSDLELIQLHPFINVGIRVIYDMYEPEPDSINDLEEDDKNTVNILSKLKSLVPENLYFHHQDVKNWRNYI